jgi:hypothetical protein
MENKHTNIEATIQKSLANFIYTVVNSYAAWDIITYFYSFKIKSGAYFEEIVDTVGRSNEQILQVMHNFVTHGFFSCEKRKGRMYYTLSVNPGKQAQIKDFIKFADSREGRLKIIYLITKYRMEH